MERANSTITSDIDSERSPVVESQPLEDLEPEPVVVTNPKTVKKKTVVKKVVPKEPKEKIIETKDTTTIVNGTTENPDIVARAVVTPTEELEPELLWLRESETRGCLLTLQMNYHPAHSY